MNKLRRTGESIAVIGVTTAIILGATAVSKESGKATIGPTVAFEPPPQVAPDMRISCEVDAIDRYTDQSPESVARDAKPFTLSVDSDKHGIPYGVTVKHLGHFTYAATSSDNQRALIDATQGTFEMIIPYPGPEDLRFTAGLDLIKEPEKNIPVLSEDFILECIPDVTSKS